jgi:hypothetical protein
MSVLSLLSMSAVVVVAVVVSSVVRVLLTWRPGHTKVGYLKKTETD